MSKLDFNKIRQKSENLRNSLQLLQGLSKMQKLLIYYNKMIKDLNRITSRIS